MANLVSGRVRTALRSWRSQPELRIPADPADIRAVTVRYLMYVLLPAWYVPGVADYIMHRRTRIERNSGVSESLIHSLMMGEAGAPLTLALLCEVNPLLLAVVAGTAMVHGATAIWDVRSALDGGREIRPAEQHIHSFLEVLPYMAVSALMCLHWDQAVAAFRRPRDRSLWRLRLRREHLPARYLTLIQAATVAFIVVPYGEELLRCIRARRVEPRDAADTA